MNYIMKLDCNACWNNMETPLFPGQSSEPKLATHVLQFIFLSDSGFRFPIAQFPSGACTPTDLFFLFWEGVLKMRETGFNIYWCILDGAEVNRQFIKLHFKDEAEAIDHNFTALNVYTGEPFVFMMDSKVWFLNFISNYK